jgi:hypothetical protein
MKLLNSGVFMKNPTALLSQYGIIGGKSTFKILMMGEPASSARSSASSLVIIYDCLLYALFLKQIEDIYLTCIYEIIERKCQRWFNTQSTGTGRH